jgi:hypothetical protein
MRVEDLDKWTPHIILFLFPFPAFLLPCSPLPLRGSVAAAPVPRHAPWPLISQPLLPHARAVLAHLLCGVPCACFVCALSYSPTRSVATAVLAMLTAIRCCAKAITIAPMVRSLWVNPVCPILRCQGNSHLLRICRPRFDLDPMTSDPNTRKIESNPL